MTSDHDRIRTAFDQLAPHYDEFYGSGQDPNFARIRAAHLEVLSTLFPPGNWVLGVGTGAGEEAIQLARQGCRVWGIDLSPRMVEVATERARVAGVADKVTFQVMPASGVAGLLGEIPPERLDGAFTGYSVMGLEPDLQAVREGLAQLIRPSGRLALCGLNDRCGFERLYHLAHLKPGLARRREGGRGELEVPGPGGASRVPVRFIDPQALADAFKPNFSVDRVFSLSTLMPPRSLPGVYGRYRRLFDVVNRIDIACREIPTFVRSSDHYLLTMRRETVGVAGAHGPRWLANG